MPGAGALTALWAGLLFSAYPLHASSVDWVSGRVDIFATLFYLSSIFCFLRLQLLKEKEYLSRALIFFALALASRETAVSLPLAIVFISALPERHVGLPKTERVKDQAQPKAVTVIKNAAAASWPFWLVLAGYIGLRFALSAISSGDNHHYSLSNIFHSFKAFSDRETLSKIFCPDQWQQLTPARSRCLRRPSSNRGGRVIFGQTNIVICRRRTKSSFVFYTTNIDRLAGTGSRAHIAVMAYKPEFDRQRFVFPALGRTLHCFSHAGFAVC